jgi:hypothetical protein
MQAPSYIWQYWGIDKVDKASLGSACRQSIVNVLAIEVVY